MQKKLKKDKKDINYKEVFKFILNNFIITFWKKKLILLLVLWWTVWIMWFFEVFIFKTLIDTLEGSIKAWNIDYSKFINILIITLIYLVIFTILNAFYRYIFDKMLLFNHNKIFLRASKKAINIKYWVHIMKNSWEFFKIFQKWVDDIFWLWFFFFSQIVKSSIFLIFSSVILVLINPLLTLTLFIPIPFMIFLALYFWWKTRTLQKKSNSLWNKAYWLVNDSFTNISIVKIFTNENKEVFKQDKKISKAYSSQVKTSIRWSIADISTNFFILSWRILVSIVWIRLVLNNEISLWTFILFFSLISWIYYPIQSIFNELRNLQYKFTWVSEFLFLLKNESDKKTDLWKIKLKNTKWNIEFKNVNFNYNKKNKIFNDLNFTIKSWETVAFVWSSWWWKSTITSLLYRFYDINSWEILIDWININKYTKKSLRHNIWMVMQDNTLFNTSILNNLIYWNPKASKTKIKKVIKKANAEFIYNLDKWLKTQIWERWLRLSWWQKQRISIARVLLSNPEILILDEATSALDNTSETIVQNALEKVMKNRTTIVIAHRLSTIKKVDKIFVLNKWKIVETWTFKELEKIKWWALWKLINSRSEWTF